MSLSIVLVRPDPYLSVIREITRIQTNNFRIKSGMCKIFVSIEYLLIVLPTAKQIIYMTLHFLMYPYQGISCNKFIVKLTLNSPKRISHHCKLLISSYFIHLYIYPTLFFMDL